MRTWAVIENGIRVFNQKQIKHVFVVHTIICIMLGFFLGLLYSSL